MTLRHVIVELLPPPELDAALLTFGPRGEPDRLRAALAPVAGFTLDVTYGALRTPAEPPDRADLTAAPGRDTILVRGVLDDEKTDLGAATASAPEILGIFADSPIASFLTCAHNPALGTHRDVARLLGQSALARAGLDGRNVLLAIVDSGIDLAHLGAELGRTPRLDAGLSWLPATGADHPDFAPGQMPLGHGTMCAFDALIAAPEATLLDLPILDPRLPAGVQHRLSDAILAFQHLVRVAEGLGDAAGYHALVVNNSWGLYQAAWDFPAGHSGRYVDNPAHPFNRITGRLERAGADILFATGNCGSECPDGRCGTARDEGILGANSHPSVLSVAGVDTKKHRVGYSTRGPGLLDPQKPDLAGYTHFRGSNWLPVDSGTSAACPVVAGVVAACRSRLHPTPDWPPARLRDLLRRTAEPLGSAASGSFDAATGFGIVSGTRLLDEIRAELDPASEPGIEDDDHTDDDTGDDILDDDDDAPDDDEFLCALLAFDDPGDGDGDAARGCTGCGPCADGSPCPGQEPATPLEDEPMSDRDKEFLDALRKFGGDDDDGMNMLSAMEDDDSYDDDDDDDSDGDAGGGDDAAFFEALEQYGGPQMAGGGTMTAGSQDMTAVPAVAALCRTWRSVRPIVSRVLRIVRRVPGIGGALVNAVNTLTRLLDAICRGTNPRALCRQWRGGLRAILVRIASIVGAIPFIGGRMRRAIRSLIAAIDAVCRAIS